MRRSVGDVADAHYEHARLAQVYDPLDPDRADLDAYSALVDELQARTFLDVGCGTGTFACRLAERGLVVVGLDPAVASLDVARTKRGADGVRWIPGDASAMPPLQVDAATMTGNVAQVFVTDDDWMATLGAISRALRPGGHLVFESRVPEDQAWCRWTAEETYTRKDVPGVGTVERWVEVIDVQGPLVSFRSTFRFKNDGAVLTSDSTLRFRTREELTNSLSETGLVVREIRDAPDRPGREFVFIAQRSE
jgi:ubiquinone/menaquinone biosynthesis C-methylase UbiE